MYRLLYKIARVLNSLFRECEPVFGAGWFFVVADRRAVGVGTVLVVVHESGNSASLALRNKQPIFSC